MLGRLAGNLAGTAAGGALGTKAGTALGTTIGLAAGGPVGAMIGAPIGGAIGGFTGGAIGGDVGKEIVGKKRMAGDFIQIDGGEKIPRSVVESTPQGQALIKALEIQQLTGGAPLSFDMGKLNPNTQSLGNKFSNFQQNNRNTLAAAMGLPTGFFG
tara:strand:- start:68 stop:535 length:468 start_codon:yes stop_codon:yes gene_type:complete